MRILLPAPIEPATQSDLSRAEGYCSVGALSREKSIHGRTGVRLCCCLLLPSNWEVICSNLLRNWNLSLWKISLSMDGWLLSQLFRKYERLLTLPSFGHTKEN